MLPRLVLLVVCFVVFQQNFVLGCGDVYRTPKGKLCEDLGCLTEDSWKTGVNYYPMELIADRDKATFRNLSGNYDLKRMQSKAHYDACNFTGSVDYVLPTSVEGLPLGVCGDTGTRYFASSTYCTSGLKVELIWVTNLCDSLNAIIGTDGLAYTDGNNWLNGTGAKPPINVNVARKVKFGYTGEHDVKLFKSAAHYATCNFSESVSVDNDVFCVYSVRDQYFSTGESTYYLGSSLNNDCVQGLKLQVTFSAASIGMSVSGVLSSLVLIVLACFTQ